MVAMGGDLTCDLGEPGRTTFRVTMPRWKGDA